MKLNRRVVVQILGVSNLLLLLRSESRSADISSFSWRLASRLLQVEASHPQVCFGDNGTAAGAHTGSRASPQERSDDTDDGEKLQVGALAECQECEGDGDSVKVAVAGVSPSLPGSNEGAENGVKPVQAPAAPPSPTPSDHKDDGKEGKVQVGISSWPSPQEGDSNGDNMRRALAEASHLPQKSGGHGGNVEDAQVVTRASLEKTGVESGAAARSQAETLPSSECKGYVENLTPAQGATPPRTEELDRGVVETKTPGSRDSPSTEGRNGDESTENMRRARNNCRHDRKAATEDKPMNQSACADSMNQVRRKHAQREAFEGTGTKVELRGLYSYSADDVPQSPSVRARTTAGVNTQMASNLKNYATTVKKATAGESVFSDMRSSDAERFSSKEARSAAAAPSGKSVVSAHAAARAMAAQVQSLLDPLSYEHSSSAGRDRNNGRFFTPSLCKAVKAFLPLLPKRRGGFAESVGCYSEGAERVVRHVTSLFPLSFSSAIHGGSRQSLVLDSTCPVFHTRGRVSLCVRFQHGKAPLPLYLTVLLIEDNMSPGQQAVQILYRITATRKLAAEAGLTRAADVATHLRIAAPIDVVPITSGEMLDLGCAVAAGKAILEPRIWAPLTHVLLRLDQAEGRKLIRVAEQARLSLTKQVVEVVSAIRERKLVLPRLTLGDFWVDSEGNVLQLLRRFSDILKEGDVIEPSASTEQVQASRGTTPEHSAAVRLNEKERLTAQSNSVGLALLLLELWCRLSPEQMKARTPALEQMARTPSLDFSTCLPSFPPEVKELVSMLRGSTGVSSIPAADAVASSAFQALQARLGHAEAQERQTEKSREAVRRSWSFSRAKQAAFLESRMPWISNFLIKRPIPEARR